MLTLRNRHTKTYTLSREDNTLKHTHKRTRAHTRTHVQTHTRKHGTSTHAHTHTHTHTHTPVQRVLFLIYISILYSMYKVSRREDKIVKMASSSESSD